MNRIKTYLLLALWLTPSGCLWAQENKTEEKEDAPEEEKGITAGFYDSEDADYVDFTSLKLPPLSILFENAKSNPSIELLAKEERIAKELLKKEKTDFLSHIIGHGGYSYGIMDNYGSNSSVTSPIYYQYMGSKQHYWNVGANISFSAEDIIDAKRKVKRQQLEVEKAGIQKEIAFEELKNRIIELYVQIETSMSALKTEARDVASIHGYATLAEKQFSLGDITLHELTEIRRNESTTAEDYAIRHNKTTTNILLLEVMTHTPIITNTTVDITVDNIEK